MKLDTQGTELQILEGIENIRQKKVISIELECGLDNYPIYKNSANFSDILNMRSYGFELLSIKVINNSFNKFNYSHDSKEIISH